MLNLFYFWSSDRAKSGFPQSLTLKKQELMQGCQMVYFQTKNSTLGKFWRVLQWTMLVYFMAIWSILRSFGIFYGHLIYFVAIRYIFPVLLCCTKKNLATLRLCRKKLFFLIKFYARVFCWMKIEPLWIPSCTFYDDDTAERRSEMPSDDTSGCQMVYFQTKNPNLGKFGRVLQWKMLLYFMDTWSISRSFVISNGHLV
jgi:hypothetical protein